MFFATFFPRQLEELQYQQATFSQDVQKAKDDLRLAQERFSRESEHLSSSHQQALEDLQTKIKQLVRIDMVSFTAWYSLCCSCLPDHSHVTCLLHAIAEGVRA